MTPLRVVRKEAHVSEFHIAIHLWSAIVSFAVLAPLVIIAAREAARVLESAHDHSAPIHSRPSGPRMA